MGQRWCEIRGVSNRYGKEVCGLQEGYPEDKVIFILQDIRTEIEIYKGRNNVILALDHEQTLNVGLQGEPTIKDTGGVSKTGGRPPPHRRDRRERRRSRQRKGVRFFWVRSRVRQSTGVTTTVDDYRPTKRKKQTPENEDQVPVRQVLMETEVLK